MEFFTALFNSDYLTSLWPTFLMALFEQEPLFVAKMAAVVFVATFVLWFLFAHLMILRDFLEQKAKGKWYYYPLKAAGYILFAVGYAYDVVYNQIIGTIIFLDWPREATLTARLQRYLHEDVYGGTEMIPGWRYQLAMWTCKHLIEPWDPDHCDLWKLALAHRTI